MAKAKPDTRFLQRRHQTWHLAVPVPLALQAVLGKRLIVQSLHTHSLREAQARRVAAEYAIRQDFARASTGEPLSPLEVEEAARAEYTGLLEHLAVVPPTKEALQVATWHLEERLEAEDWDHAADAIALVGRAKGVAIGRGSATWQALGKALLDARREAMLGRLRQMEGLPSEAPAAFTPAGIDAVTLQPVALTRPVARSSKGTRFSEIANRYVTERSDLSPRRIRRTRTILRLWSDYSGDCSIQAIDRKLASSFFDTIQKLHPAWGYKADSGKLPLTALLKKYPGQLSPATINAAVSILGSIWSFARKRGDVIGDNPFSEQSRRVNTQGWQPYTKPELLTLLQGLTGPMKAITLLALYSGMRQGELLQLRGDDVKQEGDVWFFELGKHHQLKSKAAVRRVPLHSEIREMVRARMRKASKGGLLFPDFGEGGYFARKFTMARRRLGLDRVGLSFHSCRKNFVTALDQAGVAPTDIAALVGHVRGFTLQFYSGGPGLTRLSEIVQRVTY